MNIIAQLGQLLGIAGINAYRNFIPAFLYLLLIQWGLSGYYCPEAIQSLAAHSPSIMQSPYLAVIFGVLALFELIANFQDDLREWYESSDVSRGIKAVMSILITLALLSPGDAETIQETIAPVQAASLTLSSFFAFFNGCVTWYFSLLHNGMTELARMVDPENDFKLHTLLAFLEDALCAVMLFLTIFWPVVLVFLILSVFLFEYLVKLYINNISEKRQHPCPSCGTMVSDAAPLCWNCHASQPKVCSLGFLGLPSVKEIPLDGMKAHQLSLLFSGRCPVCAELLTNVDDCAKCRQPIWQHENSRRNYISAVDRRFWLHLAFCLLCGWIPILGLLPIILFRYRVLLPIRYYQTTTNKIFGRIIKLVLKLLKIVLSFFFGLVCPLFLMIPNLFVYCFYRSKLAKNQS